MLRLRKLSLRDFRGVDHLDLEFIDGQNAPLDLVVLGGGNGSGKTSILEAILYVLNETALLPDDTAPREQQIRFGANNFAIEASLYTEYPRYRDELVRTEVFDASLTVDASTPTLSGYLRGVGDLRQEMPGGWQWGAAGIVVPHVEYFSARREPESLGETPSSQGRRSQAEARRLVELKKKLLSSYVRSLQQSLRGGKASMLSPDSPFVRLQRFWALFSGRAEELDVIASSNNPGSGEEIVLRERGKPIPSDITSLEMARRLASSRADVPSMIPLDRLSSGQLALFAFAGPLVFRDEPADFVIIDEPEQHLHIQWHRILLNGLRELSPTSQFIIATHSVEILESAKSYQRFVLLDDNDPRAHASENLA